MIYIKPFFCYGSLTETLLSNSNYTFKTLFSFFIYRPQCDLLGQNKDCNSENYDI